MKQNIQDTQTAKKEPTQNKDSLMKSYCVSEMVSNINRINNKAKNVPYVFINNNYDRFFTIKYTNSKCKVSDTYRGKLVALDKKKYFELLEFYKKVEYLIRANPSSYAAVGKLFQEELDKKSNLKLYKNETQVAKAETQIAKSETQIVKAELTEAQDKGIPKNLIGSYEGKNSQGDPFKLNINTNKYGEIIGNYTYEANNKVYGGPLYDGKLLDDQTLKIFWTEGDTNGWFKFKFRENFAKLDGDWGFIENNRELPKKGKYKGVKANTAIATKSEQEEFKPKNFDKDLPVIKIAENITVKDSSYEIEGTLIDKSKKLFVEVDGEFLSAKNGKFKIKRFSLVDEKIEIVAIDQWGNRSNPKIINIKIEDQDTQMVQRLEPLDPSKIRSKINKNRVALIIGIENYEQTPDATYANLDAKYFYEYARKRFWCTKIKYKTFS